MHNSHRVACNNTFRRGGPWMQGGTSLQGSCLSHKTGTDQRGIKVLGGGCHLMRIDQPRKSVSGFRMSVTFEDEASRPRIHRHHHRHKHQLEALALLSLMSSALARSKHFPNHRRLSLASSKGTDLHPCASLPSRVSHLRCALL